ncbi:imidazole glycerol phosphate synthase subunit HisH [Candidatus Pristimantibacillus sp. PTI5]|jgi:imidazole glycerol-phosphate synthase subunit HisH|uniref:imidazole glycerol phosphate synthase subunit HisH n=1 Tax=Candidatus Pristimantibacillus sp. PTI5 TaxID=3400422 RepID=UPI003B01F31A
MIGIIDYDAGNLHSVTNAVTHLGFKPRLIKRPEEMKEVEKIIFPGVGNARKAVQSLQAEGMDKAIHEAISDGKSLFGICLGMQLLLDYSEEGDTNALGIIGGSVRKFEHNLKVPHIGWNAVVQSGNHPLFDGVPNYTYFYFVHSYFASTNESQHTIGQTSYPDVFSSAIAKNKVSGVQFHPEKSGKYGLQIIHNFCSMK